MFSVLSSPRAKDGRKEEEKKKEKKNGERVGGGGGGLGTPVDV